MNKDAEIQFPKNFLSSAFEEMRKKLLDISGGRSRLVNLEQSRKGVVRVVDELPDELAKILLAEKSMTVIPVPEPTRELLEKYGYLRWDEDEKRYIRLKDDPDAKEWAGILGLKNDYNLPASSEHVDDDRHTDLDLQCMLYEPSMNTSLKRLATESKTSIDETGNNILFFSLGFLEWVDQAEGGRKRLAPLYMIPVRIEKQTVKGVVRYKLLYTGEDIIPNLTLQEKLSQEFGLVLPGVTSSKDEERLLTPEEYFSEVTALLDRKNNDPTVKQWQVRRFGTLATLSLGKLLMYLDLDPRRWPEGEGNLLQHDVIRRFFHDEKRESSRSVGGGADDYVLDEVEGLHEQFPMIEDADSSQMSVLIDVLKGNSMVVEGPPGTGKSQTITNLIAAAIAQGKSVLFIAEKQAALDVVKRRMDKAELGGFCLDLHSDKAKKRLVLDNVDERIVSQDHYKHSVVEFDRQVQRYERARENLQKYAVMVNQRWKNTGMTIHEVLTAATRYKQEVAPLEYTSIAPDGINGDGFGRERLDEQLERLELFYSYLSIVSNQLTEKGIWSSHPWFGLENKGLVDADEAVDLLKKWNQSLTGLVEILKEECQECGISTEKYDSLVELEVLVAAWAGLPKLNSDVQLNSLHQILPKDLPSFKKALEHYKAAAVGYKAARKVFGTELIEDLGRLDQLDSATVGLRAMGVPEGISFDELAKAVSVLETSIIFSQKIEMSRSELLPHLPKELWELFPITQNGLVEFSEFVKKASELPSNFQNVRDDTFDNEELHAVFARFRKEFDALEAEKFRLSKFFEVSDFPSISILREQSNVMAGSNLLSFLKPSWRKVKSEVASFLKVKKLPYSEISKLLGQAATWRLACDELDTNKYYREQMGVEYSGVSTDCDRYASIVNWYRSVRKEYGIGFGRRVQIARALFNLPVDIMRGIEKMHRDGFVGQIDNFLGGLKALSAVFEDESVFCDANVAFDKGTPILTVQKKIQSHLQSVQGFLVKPNMPQSDLLLAISELKELKSNLKSAQELAINHRFFNDELNLTVSSSGELPKDLSKMVATAKYVHALYANTNSEDLLSLVIRGVSIDFVNAAIDAGKRVNDRLQSSNKCEAELLTLIGCSREQWLQYSGYEIGAILIRNCSAIHNELWLDGWIKYLFAKERMEKGGFGKLKKYLSGGENSLEHAKSVMKFAIYQCLGQEIYKEQPELAERSGHEQTALQQQFAKYDELLKALQRKRVAALAADREVPAGEQGARVASYTEDCLIRHEIKKKTRNISIRNLVIRAGRAMQAYKPCFMMSPMAVAKYIPPGKLTFDLVIMDEASQVKPEYALSCFARGKNVVVVGDPKQLPPTSFFERSVSNNEDTLDSEDDGAIGEAESILDAVSNQYPTRQLRWHYRSRHESLIEFSNHRFYDSNLVVFPSPWNQSDEYGIKFNHIEGGRFLNNVNVYESQAVVAAIRNHLLSSPKESLGVVAMNSKQRDQIQDDFEAAVSSDALLRAAYEINLQTSDPLFVKNLENVQGDERDVIFISFTYGPQERGSAQIPQRFGPINGVSGWRRLNVLFTRSKKRIQVYSSMTANQILVTENSSRGVVSLKGYLEYAQTGRLIGTTGIQEGEPANDFEKAVMSALEKEGFECVPQVGVAGFFIDLAVRDPGMPGRYLMGIECDGATYHSSKSTRDRDRVRQSVLEDLQWQIRRIWSTDWFKHPEAELKPIIDELKQLATPFEERVSVEDIPDDCDGPVVLDAESYLATASKSLEECLLDFSVNVIHRSFPNTEAERHLLRPDMLERLVSNRPTSREDFTVFIPGYLRTHTCSSEAGEYLDDVLEIISDYEEREAR